MIITRTPLRIGLFGGGTDLPEYYSKYGGAVLSLPIRKFVYVTLHRSFYNHFRVAYSKVETEVDLNNLDNPIVRAAFRQFRNISSIELTTVADVPSTGTGLASSSAFAVGTLNALFAYFGEKKNQMDLADLAFRLERNEVGDLVGKQDHYGTALGGFKFCEFMEDESVNILQIPLTSQLREDFLKNIHIFYTGQTRKAKPLLSKQSKKLLREINIGSHHLAKDFAYEAKDLILRNNYDQVGQLLAKAWNVKKESYSGVSNKNIDSLINYGIECGAIGYKLLGAGGGGFVLFYVPLERKAIFQDKMKGIRRLEFELDEEGSRVVYSDE